MGLAVLERVVLERVLVAPVVQSRYCQWTSL